MNFDFDGVLLALSFALDRVEHDLLGVETNHGKRVAALAILIGDRLGAISDGGDKQLLSACSVMHDCALTEYVSEEFGGSFERAAKMLPSDMGKHCIMGEEIMQLLPFQYFDVKNVVLYHHENADGSGAFGKKAEEIPQKARLIQMADTVDAAFDTSSLNASKIQEIREYICKYSGEFFAKSEADALLSLLDDDILSRLANDNIDAFLNELLPGGNISCTPPQLVDFASAFARIIDYKSHFTRNHSIGIAQKAMKMARFYGADEELAAELYFAGALHDIGKLVVDRAVLEKPDKLNAGEYLHIQKHAYYTHKILSQVKGLEEITKWASHHHEKLDGTGYPFGLKQIS